jgi:uncharacterized protein
MARLARFEMPSDGLEMPWRNNPRPSQVSSQNPRKPETNKIYSQHKNLEKPMRILNISDIHGRFKDFKLETLPDVDAVLVAGDLTNFGTNPPHQYLAEATAELEQAKMWFEALSQRCAKVFWVQGNHDIGVPDDFLDPFAMNIRDKSVILEHDGLKFRLRGVSQTCAFSNSDWSKRWAYTTADPLKDLKAFSFDHHDIVLSHSPPYKCLDTTKSGAHIGSPGLRRYILKHQPILVVCGHVHEAAGVEMLGQTTVTNSAIRGQLLKLG